MRATEEAKGQEENKPGAISTLQPGDIIIYPEDDIINPHISKDDTSPKADLFHANIYSNRRVLHSTLSSKREGPSGIKDHVFKPADMPVPLLTLRCCKPNTAAHLLAVAQVFALTPSERKERKLPNYLTLYSNPSDRHRKCATHERSFPMAYAYLRAMRTEAKAALGGKQSLSRNKGVACSQYVLYSLQGGTYRKLATTVKAHLPTEQQHFLEHCQAIIKQRLAGDDSTKLNQVFASEQGEIEKLHQSLQTLTATMPELKLFSINPKGSNIDLMYRGLMESGQIEARIYLPIRPTEGPVQAVSLNLEQARHIPEALYQDPECWPLAAADLNKYLTTTKAAPTAHPTPH